MAESCYECSREFSRWVGTVTWVPRGLVMKGEKEIPQGFYSINNCNCVI